MDSKPYEVKLPQYKNMQWYRIVDTSLKKGEDFLNFSEKQKLKSQILYKSNSRSIVVLFGNYDV